MEELIDLKHIDEAVEIIHQHVSLRPWIGLILGSGLRDVANIVENFTMIPYEHIPHWPVSTIGGHASRLVIGDFEQEPV